MKVYCIFSGVQVNTSSIAIGNNNTIPWDLPDDRKFFRRVTIWGFDNYDVQRKNIKRPLPTLDKQNAVIMGRKTYESLPKYPLPHRRNIIISKTLEDSEKEIYPSVSEAINALSSQGFQNDVYVIGGSQVYHEAMKCHPKISIVYTKILQSQWKHRKYDTFVTFDFRDPQWMPKRTFYLSILETLSRPQPVGTESPVLWVQSFQRIY
jgi:dihydrofolate reductase